MPTYKQIESNRANSAFNPVYGGGYSDGTLYDEATLGRWYGNEALNSARRRYLRYSESTLSTNHLTRFTGAYIRCVSEEKTVLDLTYMQDRLNHLAFLP